MDSRRGEHTGEACSPRLALKTLLRMCLLVLFDVVEIAGCRRRLHILDGGDVLLPPHCSCSADRFPTLARRVWSDADKATNESDDDAHDNEKGREPALQIDQPAEVVTSESKDDIDLKSNTDDEQKQTD